MQSDWTRVSFTLTTYTNNPNVYVLATLDDMLTLLDDHIVKTTTMKNSPFIAPFENEVYIWFNELVK